MKSISFVAAGILALSPVSLAFAQNQLPSTIVTAPKPVAKPRVQPRVIARTAPSQGETYAGSVLPVHPDPSTPNVRGKDWNAPGVMNLHYMNDVQFAAFQAAHPTAVFYGRCYAGQDPDPNIRFRLKSHVPLWCDGRI
jgi:hypothetical protein